MNLVLEDKIASIIKDGAVEACGILMYPGVVYGETGAQGATGTIGIRGETGAQGNLGSTGLQGAIGETGLTGATGVRGSTGAGIQGATGLLGAQGQTGLTGERGALGFTGLQGQTGLTGSQGQTGLTGERGALGFTGLQGQTGLSGSNGSQGVTGLTGSRGDVGFTGLQGQTGLTGNNGIQGQTGLTGSRGDVGFTGLQGQTGLRGTTGLTGQTGIIGIPGTHGPTGVQGTTGLSAVGTQGQTGLTGSRGEIGFTGLQGRTGLSGAQGVTGSQGIAGLGFTGLQGATGSTGVQGITGPQIIWGQGSHIYPLIPDRAVTGLGLVTMVQAEIKLASFPEYGVNRIQGHNLEIGSGQTVNRSTYIDFHGWTGSGDFSARFLRNSGENGNFQILNQGTGGIRFGQNSVVSAVIDSNHQMGVQGATPQVALDVGNKIGFWNDTINSCVAKNFLAGVTGLQVGDVVCPSRTRDNAVEWTVTDSYDPCGAVLSATGDNIWVAISGVATVKISGITGIRGSVLTTYGAATGMATIASTPDPLDRQHWSELGHVNKNYATPGATGLAILHFN